MDERHFGRVLYGTLCVCPYIVRRTAAVHTVLEDETGKAVRVALAVTVPPSAAAALSMMQALFSKGRKMAIREPCLRCYADGWISLQVDNPSDIVYVDHEQLVPAGGSSSESESDAEREKAAADRREREVEASAKGKPALQRADLFRVEGNAQFLAQRWNKAIAWYSKCIEAMKMVEIESTDVPGGGGELRPGDSSCRAAGPGGQLRERLKVTHANRAEAWLRTGQYAHALRDVEEALKLDPEHARSLRRRARALLGLQRFQEAMSCLKQLLARAATGTGTKQEGSACRQEINAMLRDAVTGDMQSRLGEYDLDEFYLTDHQAPPSVCADFVGPVEVRAAGDMGRGLFVTRDVKEGELLLVSNALAVTASRGGCAEGSSPRPGFAQLVDLESDSQTAQGDSSPQASSKSAEGAAASELDDLVAAVVQACEACPRKLQQVYALADSVEGVRECPVPPMSLFTPPGLSVPEPAAGAPDSPPPATGAAAAGDADHATGGGQGLDGNKIDLPRIRRIVDLNSFQESSTSAQPGGTGDLYAAQQLQLTASAGHDCSRVDRLQRRPTGLWVLPAFINHSCAPNSMWTHIGSAIFVRAFRNLSAGDEVTIAYTYVHQPPDKRTGYFTSRGCRCACPRCALEHKVARQFPKAFAKLAADYALILDADEEWRRTGVASRARWAMAAGAKIATELEQVLETQLAATVDEASKNWIRSSYLLAYLGRHKQLLDAARRPQAQPAGAPQGPSCWIAWAQAMDSILSILASCSCDVTALGLIAPPLEYFPVHALPKHFGVKWTAFARRMCRCLYGPLRPKTVKAIMKKHATQCPP